VVVGDGRRLIGAEQDDLRLERRLVAAGIVAGLHADDHLVAGVARDLPDVGPAGRGQIVTDLVRERKSGTPLADCRRAHRSRAGSEPLI
jgi:hypothetical protein